MLGWSLWAAKILQRVSTRQFYKEDEEVGEFVHQQTGSFHRTQREMSGGIKQSRSTKEYGNWSGLWVLNGDVRMVVPRMVSAGRPESTQCSCAICPAPELLFSSRYLSVPLSLNCRPSHLIPSLCPRTCLRCSLCRQTFGCLPWKLHPGFWNSHPVCGVDASPACILSPVKRLCLLTDHVTS